MIYISCILTIYMSIFNFVDFQLCGARKYLNPINHGKQWHCYYFWWSEAKAGNPRLSGSLLKSKDRENLPASHMGHQIIQIQRCLDSTFSHLFCPKFGNVRKNIWSIFVGENLAGLYISQQFFRVMKVKLMISWISFF